MPLDHVSRLARQHARTAHYFGVDFVPIGRGHPSAPTDAATPPTYAASAPAPAPVSAPRRTDTGPGTSLAEQDPQSLLDALRERYERDAPHAQFITAHTNIVFGEGDPRARLMFVGEAPGEEEDKTGRPFVGRAGQLLNKMINAMGLRREDVYITNVLKTRPPNNATPTVEEAQICRPYLHEQIRIVRPEVIVTLGLPSSRLLLDSAESMGRLRGVFRQVEISGLMVDVMPTYHPAYVLRSYTPEVRGKVWSDLRKVLEKLGLPVPEGPAGS